MKYLCQLNGVPLTTNENGEIVLDGDVSPGGTFKAGGDADGIFWIIAMDSDFELRFCI